MITAIWRWWSSFRWWWGWKLTGRFPMMARRSPKGSPKWWRSCMEHWSWCLWSYWPQYMLLGHWIDDGCHWDGGLVGWRGGAQGGKGVHQAMSGGKLKVLNLEIWDSIAWVLRIQRIMSIVWIKITSTGIPLHWVSPRKVPVSSPLYTVVHTVSCGLADLMLYH